MAHSSATRRGSRDLPSDRPTGQMATSSPAASVTYASANANRSGLGTMSLEVWLCSVIASPSNPHRAPCSSTSIRSRYAARTRSGSVSAYGVVTAVS
jgi:hypothetical protein